MADSTIEARNKRLDALVVATKEWGNKRVARLEKDVARLKTILRGRTGSERLASQAARAAEGVVVDSIEEFVRVGSQ